MMVIILMVLVFTQFHLECFGPTGGASQSDVTNSMLYAAGLPNITGQFIRSVPIRVVI